MEIAFVGLLGGLVEVINGFDELLQLGLDVGDFIRRELVFFEGDLRRKA